MYAFLLPKEHRNVQKKNFWCEILVLHNSDPFSPPKVHF